MKKIKIVSNLVFWLTIISAPISFALSSEIGEADIFGVAGIVRYSWIMLFFIPIPLSSIVIGYILKKHNMKYIKNYIVALICIPLLVIFGSYRLIFSSAVSYTKEPIYQIENTLNIKLPQEIKIASLFSDNYTLSYVKTANEDELTIFERNIQNNNKWTTSLNTSIKNALPFGIQAELTQFDFFMFFDVSSNNFNVFPTSTGNHPCVFLAYDKEVGRFIILSDYELIITQ